MNEDSPATDPAGQPTPSGPIRAPVQPAASAAPAAPAEPAAAAAPSAARFVASHRALAQRRALALLLAALAGLAAALLLQGGRSGLSRWVPAAALLGAGALAALVLGLRDPLKAREVLLGEHALELRRGSFRRLVVFESIRHLRTEQSPDGRLWSLRLDLEDDSVTLRDLEGLSRLFAETAQRRPAGSLIEVHEAPVDWGEPLPWILLILGLGTLAALLGWIL